MQKNFFIQGNSISQEDSNYFSQSFRSYNESFAGKQQYIPVNVIVSDTKGQIVGGALGGIIWGWLSVEQFWIDKNNRNKGLGTLLLVTLEQEAAKHSIFNISHRAFTKKWIEFFVNRGYKVDGILEERPPGYQFNFLSTNCRNLSTRIKPVKGFVVSVLDQSNQEKATELNELIYNEFNELLGDIPFKMIKTIVKDDTGKVIGGISGYIGWGWLYISVLWVDKNVRNQGIASKLLDKAEQEARDLGVTRAFMGTTEFQAPDFYKKKGYETFSIRNDLPPGYKNYSMKKKL